MRNIWLEGEDVCWYLRQNRPTSSFMRYREPFLNYQVGFGAMANYGCSETEIIHMRVTRKFAIQSHEEQK